jgi:hypothetical protein
MIMTKIFISYRRADSRKDAGRIYDRLIDAFGKDNVFKDVDNIPFGKDFRDVLQEAADQCDVQLAIIGQYWLTITNEDGTRRLDNPDDFVRIEVESALQRDDCLLIPVLVDHAAMPEAEALPATLRELAFKNATAVRDDPDFHSDVSKIIRELKRLYGHDTKPFASPSVPTFNVHQAIGEFYEVFDAQDWDRSRQILTEIRTCGHIPRLFNIDAHEQAVWNALEEIEREQQYNLLRMLAGRGNRKRGWESLQMFMQDFPDYDPDNLVEKMRPKAVDWLPAPFDWIVIPDKGYSIGKYPVTNAQFAMFIDVGGYAERAWWTEAGWDQCQKLDWTEPRYWKDSAWNGAEQPVVGISWYEAVAFCRWLSFAADEKIMLPTERQWQYAAQGDDGRKYPWGNSWDSSRCRNSVAGGYGSAQNTSPVTQYEGKTDSPFGVVDMAGNVWEWCRTAYKSKSNALDGDEVRVLRGGSWDINRIDLFRCNYRFRYFPGDWDYYWGFRLALF